MRWVAEFIDDVWRGIRSAVAEGLFICWVCLWASGLLCGYCIWGAK